MHSIEDIREIERPLRDIPDSGLACDLLWADPFDGDGFVQNDRGVSFVFGADVVSSLRKLAFYNPILRFSFG